MEDDGFVFVKSRRKKSNNRGSTDSSSNINECQNIQEEGDIDLVTFRRRLLNSRLEVKNTETILQMISRTEEWCLTCCKERADDKTIFSFDIVCYGLGKFMSSVQAREQLVFLEELLNLQRKGEDSRCFVYDPIFSNSEKSYLTEISCTLIDHNEEGKRPVEKMTVFFMPHCGTALINNLLFANWSPKKLNHCFIIGNSFSSILERTPDSTLRKQYSFIQRISPYIDEYRVPVSEETLAAFSDTALIQFRDLPDEDQHLWKDCVEPKYDHEEIEIIMKQS